VPTGYAWLPFIPSLDVGMAGFDCSVAPGGFVIVPELLFFKGIIFLPRCLQIAIGIGNCMLHATVKATFDEDAALNREVVFAVPAPTFTICH
tara:strand:- start:1045 stop:1320 length:276 start_codon:yes stop_codon:yes gene_type:complete